jgi:probable HAF family extracellular repeat protein
VAWSSAKYKDVDGRDHGFLRNRWGRYVRIDVPGAGGTEAYKVNDRSQVVGSYNPQGPLAGDPGSKGFLFERGRFVTIDMPGAAYTQALGINDAGVVVGEYLDNDGNFHGFRWHRGRMETIEVPGSTGTSVSDINDHGDLVGVHGNLTDGIRGFVLWNRPHARFESFDAFGARYTLVFGINNRRQIVGAGGNELVNSAAQGFLLTGGAKDTLTPIEIRGTTNTVGTDINNRRQITAGIFPPDQQADTAQPLDMTAGMTPPPDSPGDAGQPTGQGAAPPGNETTARIRSL